MASIQKKGNTWYVIYRCESPNGEVSQKWERALSHKQALKRKAEIENQQYDGTFINPNTLTVQQFLDDFVELYGTKNWGNSTYSSNMGLIRNYIIPLIGNEKVQNTNKLFRDEILYEFLNYPHKHYIYKQFHNCKNIHFTTNLPRLNEP